MLNPLIRSLLMSSVLTGIASATPVTFDFQNVTFTDNTQVTGSFVYDPATLSFSNVDITTSAGSLLPAFTFDASDSSTAVASNGLFAVSNESFSDPYPTRDGKLFLYLTFLSPLSASGGADNFDLSGSFECQDCDPVRYIAGGSVIPLMSVAATPEPSSLVLLGTGLVGVFGVAKRRLSSNPDDVG